MLKFIPNNSSIMGLTLSNLGLFIATGILLAAVFSFIYLNDFNKKAELDNISNSFTTFVEAMDTKFFENKSRYFFPKKDYDYSISFSTEYISIQTEGFWNSDLISRKTFFIKPLPRLDNPNWTSGKMLHSYLKNNFGNFGNESDPINSSKELDVNNYLNIIRDSANFSYALNPFIVDKNKELYVEKIYVFYDMDGDDSWNKNIDYKSDLIIIYQK